MMTFNLVYKNFLPLNFRIHISNYYDSCHKKYVEKKTLVEKRIITVGEAS